MMGEDNMTDKLIHLKESIRQKEFIYTNGKDIANQILRSVGDQGFLDIIEKVRVMCEEYRPLENSYHGAPCMVDIMSEAFRHVNYELENIIKSGGRSNV